jgi:membrane fusion protein, multidrug efflux system
MTVRNRFLTTVIPIVTMAFGLGCGQGEPVRNDATLEPLPVTVTEVELVSEVEPIQVRGIVQPARQATISSRAMGPVVAVMVRAGATVRKNQILLEIQPAASEGQLSQTEGALAQARAGLALAERNYRRYQALHDQNAASDLELDMARMQYDQASGAVAQAEGAVQTAASVAEESAVRAPFAARVIETKVEVGDLAAPGRPLVELESTGGQQIWLTVRESDIARVSEGEGVDVEIDARPDLGVLRGSVVEIVPTADSATHTFTVKVGLGNAMVSSGLSGRATFSGDRTDRFVVPVGAVHRRGGLELVVVRAEDGTARTRAVTTGDTLRNDRIEVLSGLSAGEVVAVNAPGPVADGTPLEVER